MIRVCAVLALTACGSSNDPAPPSKPAPKPIDAAIAAPPIDAVAALAPPVDAGTAPCPQDAPIAHAFAFGSLSLPAGWCWRRVAEGDDQSGVIVDDHARERAVFTQLSHGAKVGDACDARRPDVRAASAATSHGVAFESCQRTDGLHCLSFHGDANICTLLPELPGFAIASLVDTLAHT